jgi:hypothetical protein
MKYRAQEVPNRCIPTAGLLRDSSSINRTAPWRFKLWGPRVLRSSAGNADKAAYDSYIAYFGTYSVDRNSGAITHHVTSSLDTWRIGTDQVRTFVLKGDSLLLSAVFERNGVGEVHELLWKREGKSQH